jgi:hypothetical protein
MQSYTKCTDLERFDTSIRYSTIETKEVAHIPHIRYIMIETKEVARIGYNRVFFPHKYSGEGRGA